MNKKKLKSKLSLIKDHVVRLDYAKEKASRWVLDIKLKSEHLENRDRYKAQEFAKLHHWYKNKVEYHLEKIKNHINDCSITSKANKEVESNIKVFLDKEILKEGNFVDASQIKEG